jgi:hypothetical protein
VTPTWIESWAKQSGALCSVRDKQKRFIGCVGSYGTVYPFSNNTSTQQTWTDDDEPGMRTRGAATSARTRRVPIATSSSLARFGGRPRASFNPAQVSGTRDPGAQEKIHHV